MSFFDFLSYENNAKNMAGIASIWTNNTCRNKPACFEKWKGRYWKEFDSLYFSFMSLLSVDLCHTNVIKIKDSFTGFQQILFLFSPTQRTGII